MTSRERVKAALNHVEPDKVPIDFGGQDCSMMHITCVAKLREYYGLKGPVKLTEVSTMTGMIDDDLKEAMGCDVEALESYKNFFGIPKKDWKEWNYMGYDILVPGDFNVTDDGDGGYYIYPSGDMSAPPSGHMPKGGFYFDNIIRTPDIDEEHLDYHDNLEEYQPVPDDLLTYYKEQIAHLAKSDRAVTACFGYAGLGDAALVPGPTLAHPKGIRSIDGWYMAPLLYPEYIHDLHNAQIDIAIENYKKIAEVVGDEVDVAFTCGADFGTQRGPMCSREVLEEFYIPYYKRMNDWIHENTSWKTLKHCCGAIFDYIPLFIEAGFDALNPVQCSAVGMDPQKLKDEYGKDITFWGGGVDTQRILPFGTPEQVREQVLERCEIFSKGGGYIFNSIHIVQCGTPVENIVAMIDAAHEFNGDRR